MHTNSTQRLSGSLGVTLIEIVVALTVSSILLVSLVASYIAVNNVLHKRRALSQHIYASNKVIQILRTEVAKAGQLLCGNVSNGFMVQPLREYKLDRENSIALSQNTIRVSYQSYPGNPVIASYQGGDKLLVGGGYKYSQNAIVVISDCESGQINKVISVADSGKKQVLTLEKKYSKPLANHTRIGELVADEYYLADGLFRRDLFGKKDLVVNGITAFDLSASEAGIVNLSFDTRFMSQTTHWIYILPVLRGVS